MPHSDGESVNSVAASVIAPPHARSYHSERVGGCGLADIQLSILGVAHCNGAVPSRAACAPHHEWVQPVQAHHGLCAQQPVQGGVTRQCVTSNELQHEVRQHTYQVVTRLGYGSK